MPTIIRRRSDNVVTHAGDLTLTTEGLTGTLWNDRELRSAVTSETHEAIEVDALPEPFPSYGVFSGRWFTYDSTNGFVETTEGQEAVWQAQWTPNSFKDLLSDTLQGNILSTAQTDVDVFRALDRLNGASVVDVDDQETIDFVDLLVSKGLLTSAQRDTMLKGRPVT